MTKQYKKIDMTTGKYCEFPGITVISAIQEADRPFWANVYNSLKSSDIFCKYYSPLPDTSYHMTAFEIETKSVVVAEGKSWKQYVNDRLDLYKKLHCDLIQANIHPQIKPTDCSFNGSLILALELSSEQREYIQILAKKYGLEAKIPEQFHITLAYQYQHLSDPDDFMKIYSQIEKLKRPILKKTFTLEPPKLCSFNSMEEFTPWTGDANPFIKEPVFKLIQSYFFSSISSHGENTKKNMSPNLTCAIL